MISSSAVETAISHIKHAAAAISESPYRRGNELIFPEEEELVVTGDLHGQVASFERMVEEADLARHGQRHLLLQELVHGKKTTEAADESSILIERAAALVTKFPTRVHILMGNHEMAEFTGRLMMKNSVIINELFKESLAERYGERAEEMTAYLHRLWKALPLAARTMNRVFVSHSTPSGKMLSGFDAEVLKRSLDVTDFLREGGSAYALLWGRDFSEETAERLRDILDADFFIVGHTPCEEGYKTPNSRHIILDSQGPEGKYLPVPLRGALTYEQLAGRIRPIWE